MCQMRIPLGRVALLVFGMAVPMAAAAAQDQGPCAQRSRPQFIRERP
jgi:hypothetical protein